MATVVPKLKGGAGQGQGQGQAAQRVKTEGNHYRDNADGKY